MRRLRPLGVVLGLLALLVLAPRDARADERVLRVASSLTSASRSSEGLVWQTRYVLAPGAEDLRGGGLVRFASALPEDEILEPRADLVPVLEGGRLAAIYVAAEAVQGRVVEARFLQKTAASGSFRVGAPVAAGSAVQIVDGDLGGGARLTVEPSAALERHVGFVSARAIGEDAREEARRLTGFSPRVTGGPIFVRGDDVRNAGGLVAHVETARTRARGTFAAAAAIFVALVVALALVARRLRHVADVERADALLAAEIERETL